jgi:hypothetical protein
MEKCGSVRSMASAASLQENTATATTTAAATTTGQRFLSVPGTLEHPVASAQYGPVVTRIPNSLPAFRLVVVCCCLIDCGV